MLTAFIASAGLVPVERQVSGYHQVDFSPGPRANGFSKEAMVAASCDPIGASPMEIKTFEHKP